MKISALIAAACGVALCAGAQAAEPVALLTPIAFDHATDQRMQVREECKLGDMLEKSIGDALRRSNKGAGTTTSAGGDVVEVTVTTIWGAPGNNWTGPKGLAINTVLMHDGREVCSAKMHRTTMGGFWGAFKGICGFMERDAAGLGKEVARWVQDSHYRAPEESEPEAPADAGAASVPAAASVAASGSGK